MIVYLSIFAVSIILLFLIMGIAFLKFGSSTYPEIVQYESEKYFSDSNTKEKETFPSFKDNPTLYLSVIVPAYNEFLRLPTMLDEAIEYLEKRSAEKDFSYEIIIVDDGSSDGTSKLGKEYSSKYSSDKIRVLTLEKNRGKGGAVRMGMMRARGKMLLFADADGATKFADFKKLETELTNLCNAQKDIDNCLGIVCGSRAHLEQASIAERSYFRTVLMYGFHFCVWLFTVKGVKDTQCGFKLLTRRTARIVFNSLHIERWAFDVEMLYIAQMLSIPINEVAVNWTEIEGSKVTPIISWIQMGIDLILIWLRYALGIWKIKASKTELS